MKALLLGTLVFALVSAPEKPLRKGLADTYSFRDASSPGIIFEASTRPGISLSDLHDPNKMKAFLASMSTPALPFYIRVFADHIIATDTRTGTTEVIALRDLVSIDWRR